MTRQTITTEIDIPDGFEFVRIGNARKRELCLVGWNRIDEWLSEAESQVFYIIIRPIWQPPSWMRPGWIAALASGSWYWSSKDFVLADYGWSGGDRQWICIWFDGKPTVGDFTPPPCDDWRTSKRRIGDAE